MNLLFSFTTPLDFFLKLPNAVFFSLTASADLPDACLGVACAFNLPGKINKTLL